ncbi:Putative transcription factor SEF1 [Verticillium dahliae VDG2]|nr:Putative transcription factor SEF1 [Verticillium dahliae VDG2]
MVYPAVLSSTFYDCGTAVTMATETIWTTTWTTNLLAANPQSTWDACYTVTETITGNPADYTRPALPPFFVETKVACGVCEGGEIVITAPVAGFTPTVHIEGNGVFADGAVPGQVAPAHALPTYGPEYPAEPLSLEGEVPAGAALAPEAAIPAGAPAPEGEIPAGAVPAGAAPAPEGEIPAAAPPAPEVASNVGQGVPEPEGDLAITGEPAPENDITVGQGVPAEEESDVTTVAGVPADSADIGTPAAPPAESDVIDGFVQASAPAVRSSFGVLAFSAFVGMMICM